MDITTTNSERDLATAQAKKDAQDAVLQLKSPALNKVIAYLSILCENEMIRCGSQDDEMIIRRSQGKVTSFVTTVELLEYEPVAFQSSVIST